MSEKRLNDKKDYIVIMLSAFGIFCLGIIPVIIGLLIDFILYVRKKIIRGSASGL